MANRRPPTVPAARGGHSSPALLFLSSRGVGRELWRGTQREAL